MRYLLCSRRVLKVQAVIATAIMAAFASPVQASEAYKNKNILGQSAAKREWFYFGSFLMLGQMVSQHDEKQGQCIWNWYFSDVPKRMAVLEDSMRQLPESTVSAMIMALTQQYCGKLR